MTTLIFRKAELIAQGCLCIGIQLIRHLKFGTDTKWKNPGCKVHLESTLTSKDHRMKISGQDVIINFGTEKMRTITTNITGKQPIPDSNYLLSNNISPISWGVHLWGSLRLSQCTSMTTFTWAKWNEIEWIIEGCNREPDNELVACGAKLVKPSVIKSLWILLFCV